MRTMVVAPHPDDETLGCGGTLLRGASEGDELAWVIVTEMTVDLGYESATVERRRQEVGQVAEAYGFSSVYELGFPTTQLDSVPMSSLVTALSGVFQEFEPETLLLPWRGDVHTDHRSTFDACVSASKVFRLPSVRRWLAYETLSETEAALSGGRPFVPTRFVNVDGYLERKVEILLTYRSEVEEWPFPRSPEAVRSRAIERGMAAGFQAAEAFVILRERV